jgi:hypothetical protein
MVMKNAKIPKTIWTYAYQIVPAQAHDRLNTIKALLAHEHTDAARAERTWAGQVVLEHQVTHILVVCDSPELNCEVNQKLEAELKALNVGFSVTVPMVVVNDEVSPPGAPSPAT